MSIRRWEPFSELMSLREAMNRLLEDSFVRPPSLFRELMGEGRWVPLDMYETENEVVLEATLSGFKSEDIDVSITGDTLTIKAEHKEAREDKNKNYIYRERRYGSFSRSVTLPTAVKADEADAKYENGTLVVTVPKAEEVKPKQIKVKTHSVVGEK